MSIPRNYKIEGTIDLGTLPLSEIADEMDNNWSNYRMRAKISTRDLILPLDYAQLWYHFRYRNPDVGNIPHKNEIKVVPESDFDDAICEFEGIDPIFEKFVQDTDVPRHIFFIGDIFFDKKWSEGPVFILRFDGEDVLGIAIDSRRERRDIKVFQYYAPEIKSTDQKS